MTIRLTTEAPAATPHSNPQRNLLMRSADTRWFALADFAIVSISVVLLTAQALDPGQLQIGGWPLILALIPWGIRLAAGRFPFHRTRLDLFIALFLLTAAMGVWTAYDQDFAWAKFWLIIGGIMIFYALAGQPQANHWIVAGFLALLGALMASFFLLTHDWILQPAKIELITEIGLWWMSKRPSLPIQGINPNAAAGVVAMMTPFLLALGLRGWRERRILSTIAVIASSSLILTALIMATSRGALLALATAAGIWLLWGLCGTAARLLRMTRSKVFAIVLLSFGSFILWFGLTYPARALAIADSLPGPTSAGTRLELARGTLTLIGDFPYTGGGLNSFPGLYSRYILNVPFFVIEHGHNLFLDLALEVGILGLLAIITILIRGGWLLAARLRQIEASTAHGYILCCAALAALLVMSLHGLVDYSHQGAPLLFLLVGMAVAISRPGAEQEQQIRGTGLTITSDLSRFKQLQKPVIAAIILAIVLPLIIGLRRPLLSAWYANLGALQMARIELEGWPNQDMDTSLTIDMMGSATDLFRNALQVDANNLTAHHRLGLIANLRGDYAEAIEHLEHIYHLNGAHSGIWRPLGNSYVWSGRFQDVSLIDKGSSFDMLPDDNEIFWLWLAAEHHPRDSLWLAYESLRASDAEIANVLIQLDSLGARNLAPRIISIASERLDGIVVKIQEGLENGDYELINDAAMQSIKAGGLDDALLAYHALGRVDPEAGVLPLAEFLWQYEGNSDAAEAVMRKALEAYPGSGYRQAWLRLLAGVMRGQQRWDEAEEFYRQALSEDPGEWSAYIGLGWVYIERDDDLEAALAELQKAISLVPDRGEGYFAIGEVLGRKQLFSEADIWIEQALQIDGENRWYYLALANNARANGDLNRGIALYQETLTRFPDFTHGYSEIAWAYRLNDQADLSIASIEKAIELADSPDQWILLRAATIYEWAGDIDRALSLYHNTLAVNPDNEAAKEGVGRLLRTSE